MEFDFVQPVVDAAEMLADFGRPYRMSTIGSGADNNLVFR